MKKAIFLLLVSIGAHASDKPSWKAGCVSMFLRQMQEMASRGQLALDPGEQREFSEARCEKVKTTINWSQTKDAKFDGCADAVQFLLDGSGTTDPSRRKAMLINYCT
jgi:hypothetical protein